MPREINSFPFCFSRMKQTGKPVDASILFMGSSNVGKTRITRRIETNHPLGHFNPECTVYPEQTIVDFKLSSGRVVKVLFTDPPGTTNSIILAKPFFRGLSALIGIVDAEDLINPKTKEINTGNHSNSYQDLKTRWIPTAIDWCLHDRILPLLVIVNKMDLLHGPLGKRRLGEFMAWIKSDLSTWKTERIQLFNVIATSALLWAYPSDATPLDPFLIKVIDGALERQALDVSKPGERITLLQRDIDLKELHRPPESGGCCV